MRIQLTRIACLLLFFALAVNTAVQLNPTVDEPIHVTRGIKLWQTGGDMRFQLEHTPISHWLNGLLTQTEPGLPDITTMPGWEIEDRLLVSNALIWGHNIDVEAVFFLARIPIIMLALISCALTMRWAGQWGGESASLVAGFLFALSPNLLAHGSMATTDFMVTAGYLFALYGLWQYIKRPSWKTWLAAGLLLGFGIVSKITGALLAPLSLILLMLYTKDNSAGRRWITLIPVAGVVVWATYLFAFGPARLLLEEWVLPLPAPAYWYSLTWTIFHVDSGHKSFFMGMIREEGWWSYFAVAWLIKTPLPVIGLACIALGTSIWKRAFRETLILWLPALLLFGLATFSRLNIGYRHILPTVPLIIIWGSVSLSRLNLNRTARTAFIILLIGYGGYRIAQHPHHLAFFNLAIGGPTQGHLYLGDSNIDWGQSWSIAQAHLEREGIDPATTTIAPFGMIDPAFYGFEHSLIEESGFAVEDFAAANPPAGIYLLSVNPLQGLLAQPDLLDYFRRLEPTEQRATGYAIQRFDIESQADGDWIAHCTDPGPILDPSTAETLVGRAGLRHIYFDCRTGWVSPPGDGWVVLPRDGSRWLPEQVESGAVLSLIYSHEATRFAPSYTIFRQESTQITRTEGQAEAPARFIGVNSIPNSSDWVSTWLVTDATEIPLSIMGHFYEAGSVTPIVADGLNVSSNQWQPGDIIVQRHTLPEGASPARLQTTLYDFTSGDPLTPPIEIKTNSEN